MVVVGEMLEQVVVDDLIATESIQLGHIVRTVIGDVTGVLAKAENTTNNVIGDRGT